MSNTNEGIAAAIGRIPSGCAILTVKGKQHQTGMLVSWVQQASFDPPAVTVCVKHGRPATSLIEESGRFTLNVIGDDPTAMFKHFGKGFSLEEDAFSGVESTATEHGPQLKACIAHIACEVQGKINAGDHDVYVGKVVSGDGDIERKPYVHIRKSGLGY